MDEELSELKFHLDDNVFKKMLFLYNALENCWNIKKKGELYIFTKKHGGKKEIFDENYLTTFVEENCDLKKILLNFSK